MALSRIVNTQLSLSCRAVISMWPWWAIRMA